MKTAIILTLLLLITPIISHGQTTENDSVKIYMYKTPIFEVSMSFPTSLVYNEKDYNTDDASAHFIYFSDGSTIIISTGMIKFAIDYYDSDVYSSHSKTIKCKLNNSLWRRDNYKFINLYYNLTDFSQEILFDRIFDNAFIKVNYCP